MNKETPLTPTQASVLVFLEKETAYTDRHVSAQHLARYLWPDRPYSTGRTQKAGTILSRLNRVGYACEDEWGWFITVKGMAVLRAAKESGAQPTE